MRSGDHGSLLDSSEIPQLYLHGVCRRAAFYRSANQGAPDMASSGLRSLAYEFWAFLRIRKKWWLAPIVIILALFGSLIVFTQGSALAPFVYTIF
jgi:hypothetical protein